MNEVVDLGGYNVSRETWERLRQLDDLLHKWNPTINLVSRASLKASWTRHIADSVQIFRCVDPEGSWVDLGSGGGFPGLVVAILAADETPGLRVTLIESDQRKAAFLRTVVRETGINCTVLAKRIEQVEPCNADVLSARALASLTTLLSFSDLHLNTMGTALFPKGATWKKEVDDAQKEWNFESETIMSKTDSSAVVLKIQGVSRA